MELRPASYASPIPSHPTTLKTARYFQVLACPDIRGTMGTFSYYTTEHTAQNENTEMGGKVIQVTWTDNKAETIIYGPRNKLFKRPPNEINLPLRLEIIHKDTHLLKIVTSGQTQVLKEGEWGDWLVLKFSFNPFVKMYGIARFYVISIEPLKLYLSPVNFHPEHPPTARFVPKTLCG